MASGVNVKMGVSGVAQFKQSINQSKQAIKTLDAQLALSEKQFKATGDAESYMAEKSELLKSKLEQQKSIAENAEKALKDMAEKGADRSSKAYQDLYQQMLKAKGAMLDTETEMKGVETAGDEAAKGVKDMNEELAKVGDGVSWQNINSSLDRIGDGMDRLIAKAWALGEAIVRSSLGAGSWADELKTTAAQMSSAEYTVTPEELQRMRKTAALIDTDVETIVNARSKLLKGLGNQNKGTMEALAFLGIDPSTMSEMDVFWKAGEKILTQLDDDAEQEAKATAIFGKSWKDLIPLFQAGREEYEQTMASWSVVEDEQVDNLGKMDDQYQKLTAEWETFQNEILSAFSGPMTAGMEKLTEFVKQLNDYLDTPEGKEMLAQMGETITQLIEDLTNVDPEAIVNGLKTVVDGITDGMKWISENKDAVVTAVEAFIAVWAGVKTASGITTMLELINGIKWLKANPNISIPGVGSGAGASAGDAATPGAGAAAAGGGSAALGLAGIGAIVAGFKWAADQNKNNPEQVRGREENFAAVTEQSSNALQDAFVEYVNTQKNLEDYLDSGEFDEAKIDKLYEAANAAQEAFFGMEGYEDLLRAYSDWRQYNSLGNMDWELPESLDRLTEAAEELRKPTGGDSVLTVPGSASVNTKELADGLDNAVERVAKRPNQITVMLDGQILYSYIDQAMGERLNSAYG